MLERVTLFGLILIYNINVMYSDNCLTPISPSSQNIIICDNTCNFCNIICDSIHQCNSINIYTGALNTNVNCYGEGSCSNVIIYAGTNFNKYPPGYTPNNFDRISYNFIQVTCTSTTSCSGMRLYINGNFVNGGVLNADSNGLTSFSQGYLQVSLLETQIFNLLCGNNINNCPGARYICIKGNCQCNGETRGLNAGCSALSNNFIMTSYVWIYYIIYTTLCGYVYFRF